MAATGAADGAELEGTLGAALRACEGIVLGGTEGDPLGAFVDVPDVEVRSRVCE